MPLTTALYTGLSGLTVNQVALDVIGNNISNVNTYAFKGSRPLFDPEFSQTYNMGSAPGAVYGGSNPYQKGLGAVTSGIQRDFGQGNIKPTKAGDMAIQGDGMFVLDGPQRSYTRNGAFQVNSAEYLVSGDGNYLLGYGVDKNFNVIPGKLQRIQIPKDMVIVQPTSEMQLQGDLNPSGIVATQGTVLQSTAIQMSDGSAVLDTSHLVDLLNASGLQMFNVGDTLTLSADRGGNTAPTQTMVVSDTTSVGDLMNMMAGNMGVNTDPSLPKPGGCGIQDLGNGQYAMVITGNVGAANALKVDSLTSSFSTVGIPSFSQTQAAVGESVETTQSVYDSLGNKVALDLTFVYQSKNAAGGTTWRFFANSPDNSGGSSMVGTGTANFDAKGNFINSTGGTVSINRSGSGALSPLDISLNMDLVQAVSPENSSATSTMTALSQDGYAAGTFDTYSVSGDGMIEAAFSNGQKRTLGQVALATFGNYAGLIDAGNNTFVPGPDSGDATIGTPTNNGAGVIKDGSLETSNVDISTEFVDLITTSAGFSASSRVITTANTLLTDLLSIMR